MNSAVIGLALVFIPILLYYFLYVKKKMTYWADRGVAHIRPLPFLGNSLPQMLGRDAATNFILKIYNGFPNEKVVGMYGFLSPQILVRDPDMLEKILVKDFQYFSDHNRPFQDKKPLVNLSLFHLTGTCWKGLRNKITPTFTSGKLKLMFDQMLLCAENLSDKMTKNISDSYDIKSDLISYNISVISNVIFGIEISKGPASDDFMKHATEIFEMPIYKMIILLIAFNFPKLAKILNLRFQSKESETYFRKIINDTFEQRTNNRIQRNDYVQMLLKLKEGGVIEMRQKDPDDDYLEANQTDIVDNIEITDDLLAGQAFQFLTAGFDPLYCTMQFVLHHLSENQEIQDKVRAEVKECLEKNNGYSYKAIKEMTYLEQCIQESLRLHPIIPMLMRLCLKDYKTEFGWSIEKGTPIMIPLFAIHMDPNYFENPEIFDPDRFHPDSPIKKFTYLPFGDGPRVCIAMRFAMMQMKLALSKLIENFKFDVSPKTQLPLKMDKRTFFIRPTNLYFDIKKL